MDAGKFWVDGPAKNRIGRQVERLVDATARDAVRTYLRESVLFIDPSNKNAIKISVCAFTYTDLLAKKKFNLSAELLAHAEVNKELAGDLVKNLRRLADKIEAKCR